MQFPKKATFDLKEISKTGKPVNITLTNHLNQTFVLSAIIPNYYEFVNGRFPNLSVTKDFIEIRFGESRSEKIQLPSPQLVIEKIEDNYGNLVFENRDYAYEVYTATRWIVKEFGTIERFSLETPANTFAKKYVGKVAIYTGDRISEIQGKKCLITALGLNPDKSTVYLFFNRGYLFTDTKLVLDVNEFKNTFELSNEFENIQNL